jgi:ribosomal protein L44E
MTDRGKPEFKPIEKDEKRTDRQYFCIGCGNVATQTAFFKIEGAVIVERYCDVCAAKMTNQSQSGSGI